MASALSHVIDPLFLSKVGYDPIKDFTPITTTVSTVFVLVVNPEVPAKDIKEFIALARSKPGALNYASAGVGTPHQLATELLMSMTGTKMTHVPYKGANEIIPAVLAHDVDFTIIATFGVLPFYKKREVACLGCGGASAFRAASRRTDDRGGAAASRLRRECLARGVGAGQDTERHRQYAQQENYCRPEKSGRCCET